MYKSITLKWLSCIKIPNNPIGYFKKVKVKTNNKAKIKNKNQRYTTKRTLSDPEAHSLWACLAWGFRDWIFGFSFCMIEEKERDREKLVGPKRESKKKKKSPEILHGENKPCGLSISSRCTNKWQIRETHSNFQWISTFLSILKWCSISLSLSDFTI